MSPPPWSGGLAIWSLAAFYLGCAGWEPAVDPVRGNPDASQAARSATADLLNPDDNGGRQNGADAGATRHFRPRAWSLAPLAPLYIGKYPEAWTAKPAQVGCSLLIRTAPRRSNQGTSLPGRLKCIGRGNRCELQDYWVLFGIEIAQKR